MTEGAEGRAQLDLLRVEGRRPSLRPRRQQAPQAGFQSRPVIARPQGLVLVEVPFIDACSEQRLALQNLPSKAGVDRLAFIGGGDAHSADQHVRETSSEFYAQTPEIFDVPFHPRLGPNAVRFRPEHSRKGLFGNVAEP